MAATLLAVSAVRSDQLPASQPLPQFEHPAPFQTIANVATQGAQMSISGIASPPARSQLQVGDTVTALASLYKDNEHRQWLIELKMVEPREKEKKIQLEEAHLFSSTGHEFKFGTDKTVLAAQVLGSLGEADAQRKVSVEDQKHRVILRTDYLGVGLDRRCATWLRLHAARQADPSLPEAKLQFDSHPFAPNVVAETQKSAQRIGLTADDERVLAGSTQALGEFFSLISRTPSLQDILLPTLENQWWSVVIAEHISDIKFDALPQVQELDPTPWNLPYKTKIYAYPFVLKLNGQPALLCQLAVTEPKPPLSITAGVIGLTVTRPDGGPRLTIQVISTKCGDGSKEGAPKS